MGEARKKHLNQNNNPRSSLLLILVACVIGSALTFTVVRLPVRSHAVELPSPSAQLMHFTELLALSPEQLAKCDIALINLLCAEGLRGAEGLDVSQCMKVLDDWTEYVRSETKRNFHRFRENPAEGDGSEAKWRMLMLLTVLQQDLRVQYNPARIEKPESSSPNDVFFEDSRDVLLHGLLGQHHTGTCSSMPVLYVAVGRRLGYPVKLVATKGHLFVRWEDAQHKERFNFDGDFYSDEYYRKWPFPTGELEIKANRYLKSMTAEEELAAFLTIRGLVLKSAGQLPEARQAFERAQAIVPESLEYSYYLASMPAGSTAPAFASTSTHQKE
jgi:hypothetical protein